MKTQINNTVVKPFTEDERIDAAIAAARAAYNAAHAAHAAYDASNSDANAAALVDSLISLLKVDV